MEDAFAVLRRGWFEETRNMLDIIFLVVTALFFALAVFYVRGCERLRKG
jgi:hypothetical protein